MDKEKAKAINDLYEKLCDDLQTINGGKKCDVVFIAHPTHPEGECGGMGIHYNCVPEQFHKLAFAGFMLSEQHLEYHMSMAAPPDTKLN